ncbi:MAG: histidinol-phosphate transaminase [Coriobacteriaceae bacterium]|nr:histidinol-phosphate transaminase [Coriobacteriaceae bacterium]
MRSVRSAAIHLADLEPYDPKYLPARIYLNANENPYGLPLQAQQILQRQLQAGLNYHRYPDPLAHELRSRLAFDLGVEEREVLLGNGGDEILFNIFLAYGGPGRLMLSVPPTFSVYTSDAQVSGTQIVEIARKVDGSIDEAAVLARVVEGDIDIVMIASPNNPTGECARTDFLHELLDATDALIVVDQAYVEFSDSQADMSRYLSQHHNLAIVRSLSKAYALAGIRLGYLIASFEVITQMMKVRQPYSVDSFSALAGLAALEAKEQMLRNVGLMIAQRQRVQEALRAMAGVRVFASDANFLLFSVPGASVIWQQLYDRYGILVRDFSATPGLRDCLRVSIGTAEEIDEFLLALTALLADAEMTTRAEKDG